MRVLAAVFALLSLGAPEPEYDVLWLKNGNKILGVIVAENSKVVIIKKRVEGRKGGTIATASASIPRSEIERIERMDREGREDAVGRLDAFDRRRARLKSALERIGTQVVRLEGRRGIRTVGRHFEVLSTCDEDFVKEVTHYLDEVFSAYKQFFEIRRNAGRRVRVYLLANGAEYRAFQIKAFGASFANSAFYNRKGNYIAAYNMVHKEEAEAIKSEILDLENQVKKRRKRITDHESQVRSTAREVRRKINEEASRARRAIDRDSSGNKAERRRSVARWKKKQLDALRKRERDAQRELSDLRRDMDRAIKQNRAVIAANSRVLAERNRLMYEMLFHEGFHAFAVNFLWPTSASARVPRWLDEGLASYYEMSVVEVGRLIHGAAHPAFVNTYLKAAKRRGLVPLEKVVRSGAAKFLVAHRSNAERASLYYAQSWAIAHYMARRVAREKVQVYATAVLSGADPLRAFEALMGCSILQAQIRIRKHVESLR